MHPLLLQASLPPQALLPQVLPPLMSDTAMQSAVECHTADAAAHVLLPVQQPVPPPPPLSASLTSPLLHYHHHRPVTSTAKSSSFSPWHQPSFQWFQRHRQSCYTAASWQQAHLYGGSMQQRAFSFGGIQVPVTAVLGSLHTLGIRMQLHASIVGIFGGSGNS